MKMDALEQASSWVAVFLTSVFAVAILVACGALIWAMIDVRRVVRNDAVIVAANPPAEAYAEGFKRRGGKRGGKGGGEEDDGSGGGSGDDAEESYIDAPVSNMSSGTVNKSWW